MADSVLDIAGLNPHQREAVEATEGRVRVVAGAGSGKTRVLATRYAYLVEDIGVDPANILCMTFTNKAAQEMKQRIGSLLKDTAHVNDFVCTIHGFCVKVLRREIHRLGFPKSFNIVDEDDAKIFAKEVMKELGMDRTAITVKQFLSHIAYRKGELGAEGYIPLLLPGGMERPEVAALLEKDHAFVAYLQRQLKFLALDFDDLVYSTLYILNTFADARKFWQDELDYVQVDEVQDCNATDWELIDIVSERCGNLFIVGDPDQAIYEWRGAKPDYFVDFAADRTIVLDENYRSTPDILAVANSVINHNKCRIPKDLRTRKSHAARVLHLHADSEPEEAEWVAARIRSLGEAGEPYSGMAILYRAAHLSRAFEQALIKAEVPYTVWGGVRFFERKEIKDVLAYLRLAANPDDDQAFERVVNVPSRLFGETTLGRLKAVAETTEQSLFRTLVDNIDNREFARTKARDFTYLIEKYHALSQGEDFKVSDLLEGLLSESGLKESIRKDADEDRLQNINELLASVKLYEQMHIDDLPPLPSSDGSDAPLTILQQYLQDIALYTNADYRKDSHSVRLMTIHQAKGLEFPYVFVVGLTEGIFPSHRSIRERKLKGLEEERRLMYVAITRGEKAVVLTESEGYDFNTKQSKYPSRFLTEIGDGLMEIEGDIDEALLKGTARLVRNLDSEIFADEFIDATDGDEFAPGTAVLHKRFGRGTVVENNPDRGSARVAFGDRTVNLRYSALTPVPHK
ncbi:MAG: ATP-dependent helicase [Muribaculaceae bacterium]|nr:ATP-dependent helicase [Muribaculaceae bacterium]